MINPIKFYNIIKNTNTPTNNQLAPWCETKWVTLSSLLFLFPSYYAYNNKVYNLALLGGSMTVLSMNYWRDCKIGPRRNADLLLSKITCLVGSYYYFKNSTSLKDYFIYMIISSSCIRCYNKSNIQKKGWYIYHMGFHGFLTIGAFLSVKKICNNKKKKNK